MGDWEEFEYNIAAGAIKTKHQNGSVHEHAYDSLARKTEDRLTTLGSAAADPGNGGFRQHAIRDDPDSEAHFDPIHYNPVKHGSANSPANWPRSSLPRPLRAGLYPAASAAEQVPTRLPARGTEYHRRNRSGPGSPAARLRYP